MRDLFEGDVGTLQGWGVSTQKALCNVDTTPPDTTIASGPANPTSSTSAQFAFGSNDGGATFECRLDGAAYEPCPANMTFGGLAFGTHTVNARAIDGSENEDASPATYNWLIAPPDTPTPAASFLLAPAEDRLADALAGRYNVVAACATACRVSAKLGVSARTARRLDLSRKAFVIGSATKRRSSSGTAKVPVPLGRRARAALRGRALTKATLTVTLTEGSSKLTLKRSVSLRRSAGLQRIASRGLRLWAACARRCPLSAKLTLSAAQARRLGLKPGKAKRYQLASGRTTATTSPKVLVLAVRRSARKALGAGTPGWRAAGSGRRERARNRSAPPSSARHCAAEPPLDSESRTGKPDGSVVGVAQQVELLVVVQAVAGSSPVAHPLRNPC